MAPVPGIEGLGPRRSSSTEAIRQLLNILRNDFDIDLCSNLTALPAHSSLRLKINAEICLHSPDSQETADARMPQVHLVYPIISFHWTGSVINIHHRVLSTYINLNSRNIYEIILQATC